MVLSFGHMHRDDLGLPPLPGIDQTLFTAVTKAAPAAPADRERHPPSNDYCPICASMALVATAIPSLPPVLIVPVPISRVYASQTPAYGASTQVAPSFQARAPPLA
jgi:hypothetical protein